MMSDDDEVYVLSPDADEETRGCFFRTMARMAAHWGSVMTRTTGDGYVELILPPEFLKQP
jgi:class 3 adenylate cyclase